MTIFRILPSRSSTRPSQAIAELLSPGLSRSSFVEDSAAGLRSGEGKPSAQAGSSSGQAGEASQSASEASTAHSAPVPTSAASGAVSASAVSGESVASGVTATTAGSSASAANPSSVPNPSTAAASSQPARHAVVIGAGIAGLSTAWELQRKGWQVTVLEQGAKVGGAVQTVRRDGWQVECGPNTMMVTSNECKEMISALGLESKIVKPNTSFKKRFLVRGGVLHSGPASFGEFAKTPLFSFGAKLRLFWNLVWGGGLRRDLEDESLGSYFRRQFGKEVVDVAIRPVIAGVYAGDADRLSLRHAFPFVWEAAQRSRSVLRGVVRNLLDKRKSGTGFRNYMIDFEGGLHTLPQTLANSLATAPITNARITSITRDAGGKWTVGYATAAATGGNAEQSQSAPESANTATEPHRAELHADALVLAAPSFAIAGLPLPQELANKLNLLGEIEYPPLANVALGYRREQVAHALDGFGAVVSDKEKAQVLGVLFSSSVYPQAAPQGHVLLTSFIGGTRAPELAGLPEDKLVAHTHAQLRDLLGIEGEPVFANTAYWPRAIPQRTVGYSRFLDVLNAVEAECPSLCVVGNYRGDIALGKCAADSVLRARELDARLRPSA